jgi:hypothetical protein
MDLPLSTIPPSAPHTQTVVFLHGRGDTVHKFDLSLCYSTDSRDRSLPEIFPSFRWVFPQSEMRQCVTLSNQMTSQWFDIWNVSDFSDYKELQVSGRALQAYGAYLRTRLLPLEGNGIALCSLGLVKVLPLAYIRC